jgi:hypothetical protein
MSKTRAKDLMTITIDKAMEALKFQLHLRAKRMN